MITTFSLVAAGTHRGRAVMDDILGAKERGEPIEDVVWDPGYSLCKPGTVHHRLAQAGIHQTVQPVTHQRGDKPFSGDALLIDGQTVLPPAAGGTAGPPSPATRFVGGGEADLRGQIQPEGSVAVDPSRGAGRRWGHPVAVPVLLRFVAEPGVPDDDEEVPDGAAGPRRRLLLSGQHLGHAGRTALVAEHHVRHHRLADQHGPAAGGGVGELGPEGGLRKSRAGVLPGAGADWMTTARSFPSPSSGGLAAAVERGRKSSRPAKLRPQRRHPHSPTNGPTFIQVGFGASGTGRRRSRKGFGQQGWRAEGARPPERPFEPPGARPEGVS